MGLNHDNNKTQCQLCKRLSGQIIPLSWSGVEKNFIYDLITRGIQEPFLRVLAMFSMVTPEQPNNQVILVQACS